MIQIGTGPTKYKHPFIIHSKDSQNILQKHVLFHLKEIYIIFSVLMYSLCLVTFTTTARVK